ncbi:DUF3806 domain-containing protein [Saccharophagus degradans]|uniref:DUF3806 domain-containing protein n=1 Tax=Saccharophagus degradans TaxID=86304 RepID=UPI00247821C0|nr:DUF3806 domain-containing protein [Saccharophagus degradans]WGO96582.1 DUF3806 domain-containing protein [Saccharophagus degradans]
MLNCFTYCKKLSLCLTGLLAVMILATPVTAETIYANDEDTLPRVDPMAWINENYLSQQRTRINEILRDNYARSFRGGVADFRLLQRLIDEQVIPKTDTQSLQAMGVILGDIYVSQVEGLEWGVYEDELGRSHAVCAVNTKECLFVTTMLSRRIEVGVKPNVKRVYDKGLMQIKPFLPKRPFSD